MKNIKAILIVLTVAGVFTSVKAQDSYYPLVSPPNTWDSLQGQMGYFAINFGLAQPIGMFASAKSISYGGYAMPGSVVNLSIGLTPEHSDFGVALLFGNYTNPFNENKYALNVSQSDQARSYTPTVYDDYIMSNIMAGLLYTIPVDKISLDFRALGGILLCNFPEVEYTAYQYNAILGAPSYYNWDIASSTSTALAGDLGLGVRYNFRNMAVMLNTDYLYSNPPYSTTERVTDAAGNKSYMNLYGNMKVSAISYALGFGYQIGR
jgi:hypothetical protein